MRHILWQVEASKTFVTREAAEQLWHQLAQLECTASIATLVIHTTEGGDKRLALVQSKEVHNV